MNLDLSWWVPDGSSETADVILNGTSHKIPLASEMDFIRALKALHGAQKTWPKKPTEARWSLFESMCSVLREESDAILKIMVAEKGESLGHREHEEFLKALSHWRIEDFQEASLKVRPISLGLTAVLLDERHPWVSWMMWVAASLVYGNVVACRFLPENVQTATFFHTKIAPLFPAGAVSIFISQDGEFENMVCAHPSVGAVLVECAEWDKSRYKSALSSTWKKFAVLSETRPVTLLLEESSPALAQQLVDKSLSSAFGFEKLGRVFTLDKFYEGWVTALQNALEVARPQYLWERSLRREKWHQQRGQILKEKGVRELDDVALWGMDFSNCSPVQQQVVHGPFLSLTRAKYVHEAVKFAQTTPLRSHISLWGPEEKMATWSGGLLFQNVWQRCWPKWSLEGLRRAPFSDESYFVGAGEPGGIFYAQQRLNSLCEDV